MTKSDKKILEGAFRLFLNADYEGASTSDLEAEMADQGSHILFL